MVKSPNMRGAGLMMASMIAFTVNDACMKSLSDEVPMFQAIFLRGLATCVFLAFMAWRTGAFKVRIPRRDIGLVAIRSSAEVVAAYFFISALFNMPIANVTAILQALPLSVTLASAVVFREAIGWRRMSAILVGFFGVLLIVRPGAEGFNFYSVYAIFAVLVVTVRDLAARRLSVEVPSMAVALSAAVAVALFSGIASIGSEWVPVSGKAAWQLSGATLFIVGGYLFSVMTMRVGDIDFVAPFRYTSLLCALILGLFVFGEWPDKPTLIGSAIVVATGAFTLYRERRIVRAVEPVPVLSHTRK
jgi:drug/metabolite transporter (DMT)-like permease